MGTWMKKMNNLWITLLYIQTNKTFLNTGYLSVLGPHYIAWLLGTGTRPYHYTAGAHLGYLVT